MRAQGRICWRCELGCTFPVFPGVATAFQKEDAAALTHGGCVAPAWAGTKGKKLPMTFCIYLVLKLFSIKFIVKSFPFFPVECWVPGSPKVSRRWFGVTWGCTGAGKGGKELMDGGSVGVLFRPSKRGCRKWDNLRVAKILTKKPWVAVGCRGMPWDNGRQSFTKSRFAVGCGELRWDNLLPPYGWQKA